MKFSSLICVAALQIIFLLGFDNALLAQTQRWKDTGISHHAVVTLNVNVQRLAETIKETEAIGQLQALLETRGLDVTEIDQFRGVILQDPQLKPGADDSSHIQLTFLNARKFDGESVGKMSRYKLNAGTIGGSPAFLGDPQRTGAWGAMVVDDRTLNFGVTRMLKSIAASKKTPINPAHDLAAVSKQDVDFCFTLSDGEKIGAVFANAWRTNQFADLFATIDTGLVTFNGQSDTQLVATLTANDEADAEKLSAALKDLIAPAVAMLKQQRAQYDRMIEDFKSSDQTKRMLPMAEGPRQVVVDAMEGLKALRITREKAVVTVTGSGPSLKKLLVSLAGMILGT